MTAETIIEYACPGLNDWEHWRWEHTKVYPKIILALSKVAFGASTLATGISGVEFLYRRVPTDPLFKAMVLAEVENGNTIRN